MRKVLTTLSVGETYTRHYTLKLIKDTLDLTPLDIYIVTDFRNIIEEEYGNNPRIFISDTSRDQFKLRIPIGPNKGADDFNFNIRYKALEFVQDLEDTLIIFTDCDNSVDWWDDKIMNEFLEREINNGYTFFGPRTDLKLENIYSKFKSNAKDFDPINSPHNMEKLTIFGINFLTLMLLITYLKNGCRHRYRLNICYYFTIKTICLKKWSISGSIFVNMFKIKSMDGGHGLKVSKLAYQHI